MGIDNLFYFSLIEHLFSSMVVGPYSYYPLSVSIFLTIVIDDTSNIL
jgi:hypothetical protein